jgi:hypothetical protein
MCGYVNKKMITIKKAGKYSFTLKAVNFGRLACTGSKSEIYFQEKREKAPLKKPLKSTGKTPVKPW